jgi:hypothetical protein
MFLRQHRKEAIEVLGSRPFLRQVRKFAQKNPTWVKETKVGLSAKLGFGPLGNMKPTLVHVSATGDTPVKQFLASDSYDSVPVGGLFSGGKEVGSKPDLHLDGQHCYLLLFRPELRAMVAAVLGKRPLLSQIRAYAQIHSHWIAHGNIDVEAHLGFTPIANLTPVPLESLTMGGMEVKAWMRPALVHIKTGGSVKVVNFLSSDMFDNVPCGGQPDAKGKRDSGVSLSYEEERPHDNLPLAGMAKSTRERLCWFELFPECDGEFMAIGALRRLLHGRFKALKDEPNDLAWQWLLIQDPSETHQEAWHVQDPSWKQLTPNHVKIAVAINKITLWQKAGGDINVPCALTTAVVLGTIGDVEPTLDVVAANHFAALTEAVKSDDVKDKFLFEETGHGWCASDFLTLDPQFAKALDEEFGSGKGKLQVVPTIWNKICDLWGGAPLYMEASPTSSTPGHFPQEIEESLHIVPERPVGPHERKLPDDFVLVTHPDHIEMLERNNPEQMALVETRPLSVDSHTFIKLGQDILAGKFMAYKDMKRMCHELIEALKIVLPFVEQSDLVYLVSGTTFHYFIGSLFPDKQVFEVCPVPREDNGICPEFYLGHYAAFFSEKPQFGFEMGRMYNQWLMSPQYLRALEWEGEFKYSEPPKFHSIMPWAKERWKIESANVGFKPYDDFIVKKTFVETEKIKIYVSLGSCERLTPETLHIVQWLRTLNATWYVDPRWKYLFEGCDLKEPGYFAHTQGLHEYDWVIHHGGSGTTNTCLAVKVPQTILPQIGDQFVWAKELAKHTVPICTSEGEVRAHIYRDRLPPFRSVRPVEVEDKFATVVESIGGRWVKPFWISLHCCHDFNEYGLKDLDFVVAETDDIWVTLYDTCKQRTGVSGPLELKWLTKKHQISGPLVPGWRGVCMTATYPHHAHGWLGMFREREGLDTNIHIREEWLIWLARQCKTGKNLGLVRRSCRPSMGTCKRCKRDREIVMLHCGRCIGDIIVHAEETGEIPDLPPVVKWSGNRPKSYNKSITGGPHHSGSAIRSVRRYFQLDSRMISRGASPQVARALLDRVRDFSDVKWVEGFWEYTNSRPPHYSFKTNPIVAIDEMRAIYENVSTDDMVMDLLTALGSVLSVSSTKALALRLIQRNLFSVKGRDVMRTKWHVLVDGLRHFNDLTAQLGVSVMPPYVLEKFEPLPTCDYLSLVHYKCGMAAPIKSRQLTHRWYEAVKTSNAEILVHFFSLRLPALGTAFGVFHAVIEFKGFFYELQQVANGRTLVNKSRWAPEATPERPLVKTIVVNSPLVVSSFDERLVNREFSNLDYKVLGENCLVFANFMVYTLTKKVIPWEHFGAFGADFTGPKLGLVKRWAVSHFFTHECERRVSVQTLKFTTADLFSKGTPPVAMPKSYVGPRRVIKDYGLHALRQVEATIDAYEREGPEDLPWNKDTLLELAILGYKRFGLTSHLVSQALLKLRMNKMPTRRRKINLIIALQSTLRKFSSTRLVQDIGDIIDATVKIRMPLRTGRKPAWAPLLNISVPRHWFREGEKLVEKGHDPENLRVGHKRIVRLDLPQIVKRYEHYFEGVSFPNIGFKWVKPGEYEVGVKVPLRKNMPKMDDLTLALVKDLQEMHPFELGIFSLRYATEAMAEKVTDRYFTGTFEAGQLIPEAEQQAIAEAIFRNHPKRYENAQLINPEEVWKKWHRNYSAGFPFRFNAKGNASRQALVDAAGGKAAFMEAIRKYIASPESFPTVSHAFVKDEVLPLSYVEREKIRTIIAQDPLNYYAQMAVTGDHSKRLDPSSFSAVGVSPAHGELSALAEKHLAYKHHFAMDVTALDSTATTDAIDTIKRLRKLGFRSHPQKANIETLIDGAYSNLQASWIIDIHTGRARFKKQGLSTGHASTTPSNTEYMEILMLKAWHDVTGRPYDEFYDDVKFSSFSDDNFWSTSLPKSVFSAQKISEYWLSHGVQVRVEGESDDLSQLSFLAKRFSFEPAHLEEVRKYANRDAKVAIVHDLPRLLMKFSDFKKKNTLALRWERMVALQANCAHHPDVFSKVDEYLDALERTMTKRQFMRKFLKQHPRKTYAQTMELMYAPKNNKSGLIVSSMEETIPHKILLWWDTLRVDIMSFDGTASTYARVLNQFTGLLELGGLNVEDAGVFLRQPGELPTDPEMTLEHHVYLLNGCPGTFESYRLLAQKTPFSAFMDIEGFWATRDRFDISEEMANGLRAKVFLLTAVYTIVAWLEKMLMAVPVVGPMYKLFCSAKAMSESAYSRLNAMYYVMFGDSSLILSSMMPKDRYLSLKVLAFKVWCRFTSTDSLNFSGDIGQFKDLADATAKLAQDVQTVLFDFDISPLVPASIETVRNNGIESGWMALDHSPQVKQCQDLLADSKEPLVTGPTGCGKSTDFILSLYEEYNTVIVACPRKVIVRNSPVAHTRLYAGCQDKLTPGLINFGTAGYLRQVLGDLPEDTMLVLDEFHELDEDTLWLHSHFRGRVITISATPVFTGSNIFTQVPLVKSRNAGHIVQTTIMNTSGKLEEIWKVLTAKENINRFRKVLVIVPRVSDVEHLVNHAARLVSAKRTCPLYRGRDTVTEADWYFATSIADSALTIPGLDCVIDAGFSSGWVNGKFVTRPSSHNTSDQRRGRTGRMCDGEYIRMQTKFIDDPWDFTTPFLFNNWEVAKLWGRNLKRPRLREHGCLEALPAGYDKLLAEKNWSAIVYLVHYYQNRGDVQRTRSDYQSSRKFPESPEMRYLLGPHSNKIFNDLSVVEGYLRGFRLSTGGNVWTPDGSDSYLELFHQPVPKHLIDRDED